MPSSAPPVTGGDLPFAKDLFEAADRLRGRVESAEYKHLVLGLLFLRYLSDNFERYRARLDTWTREPEHELFTDSDKVRADILEDRDEYLAATVFWVPETARFDKLLKSAGLAGNGPRIDKALAAVEAENPEQLRGVLPRNYARSDLPTDAMGELITLVGNIDLGGDEDEARDLLGRTYEYFIKAFAKAEGHRGGEFFTPQSVVRLLVAMLEPYQGRVFDPASGSCGMFIQSARFVEAHGGRARDIALFGQESAMTNWRIGRMNLALHGLTGDIRGGESSLTNDQHPTLKADYVLANPPFNQSPWGANTTAGDTRWKHGDPPESNANFAWIQHFISHLAPYGRAGFVMSVGAMTAATNGEDRIRAKLIDADLIDCVVACPGSLFFTTTAPVCLWFIDRAKAGPGRRAHTDETLFVDARKLGAPITRTQIEFTPQEIELVAGTYHAWRTGENAYDNVAGFCRTATKDEIVARGHILTPNTFVGTEPERDDGDLNARVADLREELTARLDESLALDQLVRERLLD